MRISDWSSDVCSSDLETAKAMDRRLPPQPHAIEDVEHMVSGDSSRLGRLHGAQIAPDFPVGKGTVQRTEFLQQSQSLPRQRDKTFVAWLHPLIGNAPERIRAKSEEHTSELQSLMRISYAVFCLKKKTTINITPTQLSENRLMTQ